MSAPIHHRYKSGRSSYHRRPCPVSRCQLRHVAAWSGRKRGGRIRTKSEKASLNSETCSSVSESACSDGQVSYHTGVPAAVRGKRVCCVLRCQAQRGTVSSVRAGTVRTIVRGCEVESLEALCSQRCSRLRRCRRRSGGSAERGGGRGSVGVKSVKRVKTVRSGKVR